MQKSTAAVCLAMVMLTMALVMGAAPQTDAGPTEYEGYELDLTSFTDNYSKTSIGGVSFLVMTSAGNGEYTNRTNFSTDHLIMKVLTAHYGSFSNTDIDEIVLTPYVEVVEDQAFSNMEDLHTVAVHGDVKARYSEKSFYGSDNIRVFDLRSHGEIEVGEFYRDYSGAVIIDDEDDIPEGFGYGLIVDVSEIAKDDVHHISHDAYTDMLKIQYVGYGLVQCTDETGRVIEGDSTVKPYGNILEFPYTGERMNIGYVTATIDYGAFGLGAGEIVLSQYDNPLPIPDGYTIDGGFRGWRINGVDVGTSLDIDEYQSLVGTGFQTLKAEPIIEQFTVSFDLSGLPSGESATLQPITLTGTGTYPQLQSEHYLVVNWSVDGELHAPGSEITDLRTHTAVAVWDVRPECHYNVRYLNVDGSPASDRVRRPTAPS